MTSKREIEAIARSQWLFARLLAVYPRNHRREYGTAMAQLFRDQCRDVWRQSGSWGMVQLWLRVLPDLFKTAFRERLTALSERTSILRQRLGLSSDSPRSHVFLTVFTMVFPVVFVASLATTWCFLPDIYCSRARIKVEPIGVGGSATSGQVASAGAPYDPFFIQKEFDALQSDEVLDRMIANLKLNKAWARKLPASAPLPNSRTREKLRRMIELRPLRNTRLVEISAFSEDRDEASRIANGLAAAFRDYHVIGLFLPENIAPNPRASVELIDSALPGLRPVGRNMSAHVSSLGLLAVLLALTAGLLAVWCAGRKARPPEAVASKSSSATT